MSNIQQNINQMISSAAIATNLAKSVEEQKAQTVEAQKQSKIAEEQKELQLSQHKLIGAKEQEKMINSGIEEVEAQNKETIDKYKKLSNKAANYGAKFTGEKDMTPRQARYFNSLYRKAEAVGIQNVEDLIQSRIYSIKASPAYKEAGKLAESGDLTRYQKYLADSKKENLNMDRKLDKWKSYNNNGLEEVLNDLTNKEREKEGK